MRDRFSAAVRDLNPGYFAFVMATGIVSVGLYLQDLQVPSALLLVIAAAGYVVLLVLNGWRLTTYRTEMLDDLNDARRGFGYFTFIAGTNVLGVRLAMDGHHVLTAVLFVIAVAVWLVLGYVVPWTAVLGTEERPVIARANGTWFVWVVASQSIAVAAATLEPVYDGAREILAGVAVMSWSVGIFLYAAAGIFVAARMLMYPVRPNDLSAPYWIAMGACAITVLAGARILEMSHAPITAATHGLVSGLSVMFWAFATWLIPVLVTAGWWRHVRNRVPLRYDASLWSIVFPLGMYAVAGIYLGDAEDLPLVGAIGSAELVVAVIAWICATAVMSHHLWRTILTAPAGDVPP